MSTEQENNIDQEAIELEETTPAEADTAEVEEVEEIDHFQLLVDDYGLNDENNTIGIYRRNAETRKNELVPFPIFERHKDGISITPYTLDRTFLKAPTYKSSRFNEIYSIVRLHPEWKRKNGDIQKYKIPTGATTPPFFPVQLLNDYEKGLKIDTLYITEGYKKAFKAANMGLHTVGLVSITCMKDKETDKLHVDILKLIDKCQVKRVVWLIDADFRDISSSDITDGKELITRPNNFFSTVCTFQNLLSGIDNIQTYFAHINEDLDGHPKGLDDLLIMYRDRSKEILKEAREFDKINQGKHEGNYFVKFNITQSPARVRKHFLLDDVTAFYLHHVQKRAELASKTFRFYGTTYKYSDQTSKCEIEVPRDANNYFRVGDDYYEYISIPNRYEEPSRTFHQRQKSTIKDDHGSEIIKHIAKYKAFCNVPNHLNYQRVIHGCFNTYAPFLHEPEEGEYSMTLDFIKHIFGTNKVKLSNGEEVEYYELGLDYLQILLRMPQQILPILCLVSKDRQTGKTTFAKWLKLLFTENMAIVGNQDFENAFNAHWISKLLVCVDETKIDKEFVVEKIKSLSTSNNTMLNAKGKNQVEIETFLKFILLSNNEDNFINIDKEEIRFWVMKVPTITERVLDLEKALLHEIPAFIFFLGRRNMVTKHEERHWFNTAYLQTDILQRIKENSAPSVWKILKHQLKERFEDFPECSIIEMPLREIKEYLLRNTKYDELYIQQVLKERGYSRQAQKRGSFPVAAALATDGIELKKFNGRPYIFRREDFTDTEAKPPEDPALIEDDKLPF